VPLNEPIVLVSAHTCNSLILKLATSSGALFISIGTSTRTHPTHPHHTHTHTYTHTHTHNCTQVRYVLDPDTMQGLMQQEVSLLSAAGMVVTSSGERRSCGSMLRLYELSHAIVPGMIFIMCSYKAILESLGRIKCYMVSGSCDQYKTAKLCTHCYAADMRKCAFSTDTDRPASRLCLFHPMMNGTAFKLRCHSI
jgi:hypothetical protein